MRFYVVSPHCGLIATSNDEATAQRIAIATAVHTGRPVELHDRMAEGSR